MIDPSPLYFLDDPERAIEWLPTVGPDSPQARRTAVLVVEAVAAGQIDAVTDVFLDWARVLLTGGHSTSRVQLAQAITACTSLHVHAVHGAAAQRTRDFLGELAGGGDAPAEAVAHELACWLLDRFDGQQADPSDAWHAATVLLAAIAETSTHGAERAIAECADVTRRRLLILVS